MKRKYYLPIVVGSLLSLFSIASFTQVTFSEQIIIGESEVSNIFSIFTADLDGDGDMDVISNATAQTKIEWYENMTGYGHFSNRPHQFSGSVIAPQAVYSADLDGDGDMDVLSASGYCDSTNKIAWYENVDGKGEFGLQRIITTSVRYGASIVTADIDGDGDMDVLSASSYDYKIAWYENTDGAGNFGPQDVISTSARGAYSVYTADLDNDGDMDVLSASIWDDKIAWYENIDGLGTFGSQRIITTSADYAKSVYSVDLDGDGDMDVLSASSKDNKIAWYENSDSQGTFGPQQVITTLAEDAQFVYSVDLDGDGDMDVLSASENKVAWYRNNGEGIFGSQKIISTSLGYACTVHSADLDGDGDMDVLSGAYWDGDWPDKIMWFRNLITHVELPVFTPPPGSFVAEQDVVIDCATFGASIYYTLNGSEPTQSDYLYTTPINLAENTELKAKAFSYNKFPSGVAGGPYSFTTGIDLVGTAPSEYALHQNYPNPFNPETTIPFDVKEKAFVRLIVYNLLGEPVVTVVEDHYQPGNYEVKFDASALSSGIYFCHLRTDDFTAVRKMVLME